MTRTDLHSALAEIRSHMTLEGEALRKRVTRAVQVLARCDDPEGVVAAYLRAHTEGEAKEEGAKRGDAEYLQFCLNDAAWTLARLGDAEGLEVARAWLQETCGGDITFEPHHLVDALPPRDYVPLVQRLEGLPAIAGKIQRALGHAIGTIDVAPRPGDAPLDTCAQVTQWAQAWLAADPWHDWPGIEELFDLDDLDADWRPLHCTCTGRSIIYARCRPGALDDGLELRLEKRPGGWPRGEVVLWSAEIRRGTIAIEEHTAGGLIVLSEYEDCDGQVVVEEQRAREDWVLRILAGVLHGHDGAVSSLDDLDAVVVESRDHFAEDDDPEVAYWNHRLGV